MSSAPAPIPQKASKELSIETLRGIAILLMVAGHVIGDTRYAGMRTEDHSLFRYFYFSFMYLRMPLFTTISGYVYALRPMQTGARRPFLLGKWNRIVIPMICVGTLQYLLRTVVPDINKRTDISEIWRIYFYSFDHFWFLQAIFLVFLTVSFLETWRGALDTVRGWLLCLGLAAIGFCLSPSAPSLLSLSGYLYLLPFFILGIGLYRFAPLLRQRKLIGLCLAIFFVGIALQQLVWFKVIDYSHHRATPLGLLIGVTGMVLLFFFRREHQWLARLGYYAFGIYLFHVFGVSGSRILLHALNIHHPAPIFIVGLAAGLLGSILIEFVLMKHDLLKRLFLGLTPKPRPPAAVSPVVGTAREEIPTSLKS